MSTAERLAPCPFCGGEAKFRLRSEDLIEEDDYDVQCGTKGCYLEFGGDWFLTKDAAAALWNRRHTPADGGGQGVTPLTDTVMLNGWVNYQDGSGADNLRAFKAGARFAEQWHRIGTPASTGGSDA